MSRISEALTENDFDYLQQVIELHRKLWRAKMKAEEVGRITLNCHSTARLIGSFIPNLIVRDGFYYSFTFGVEEGKILVSNLNAIFHSWLETPDGAIIDPQPVSFVSYLPVLMPAIGKQGDSLAGMYEIESVVDKTANRKTILRRVAILQEFMKQETNEETA